jgi:hypothetical protein
MKVKMVRMGTLAMLVLTTLVMLSPQPVLAATCTSAGIGNWSVADTWDCGHVPVASDDVTIASGHTVTVDAGATATTLGTLKVQSGGSLVWSANTAMTFASSNVNGTVRVNGDTAGVNCFTTALLNIGNGGMVQNNSSSGTGGAKPVNVTGIGAGAFTIQSGGTYRHNSTRSYPGTTGTARAFDSGSTQEYGPDRFQSTLSAGNASSGTQYGHLVLLQPTTGTATVTWANANGLNVQNDLTIGSNVTFGNNSTSGTPAWNIGGSITVNGSLTFASNAAVTSVPMTVGENFVLNTGATLAQSSKATLIFNGTSPQTLNLAGGGITIANLTLNNSNGLTLSNNLLTVNSTVTLTSGDLNTTNTKLKLVATSNSITGSGDVVGAVQRDGPFSTGTDYMFSNAGVLINFNTVTTGAAPTILVNLSKTAPSGLTTAIARIYAITSTDISPFDATLQLEYQDIEAVGLTEANLRAWKYNGSHWVLQASSVNTANNFVNAPNVTGFSNWAISDSGAPTAVTLSSLQAHGDTGNGLLLIGLGAVLIIGLGAWWSRRK